MACTGPSMPDDKEIDSVTDEVMNFLKEKHRVHGMEEIFHHGLTKKNREREKSLLRVAIKELLDGRNCEEF